MGRQTQIVSALGRLAAFGCCSALGLVSKMPFYFLEKQPLSGVCDCHGCAQAGGLGTGDWGGMSMGTESKAAGSLEKGK